MRRRGPLLDYLLVLLSAVLWGSAGIFVRRIGLQGQEMVVVFWRMAMGTGFALTVILAKRDLSALRPGRHPLLLLVSGTLLALHWTAYFKSIHLLPVSTAVFLAYLSPVLVALAAPFLLGERVEKSTPMALALALAGVAFLSWGGSGDAVRPVRLPGLSFGLLTAASYAALVLMLKKLREDTGTLTIIFFQSAVGSVALSLLMPFQSYQLTPRGWVYLVVLGIFLTGATGLLYVHAARRVKAQHLGIISYAEPLSAVFYGWIFLGERPGWGSAAGGLLIAAAGLLVFLRGGVRPDAEHNGSPKERR